jgi:hypothetical protein
MCVSAPPINIRSFCFNNYSCLRSDLMHLMHVTSNRLIQLVVSWDSPQGLLLLHLVLTSEEIIMIDRFI